MLQPLLLPIGDIVHLIHRCSPEVLSVIRYVWLSSPGGNMLLTGNRMGVNNANLRNVQIPVSWNFSSSEHLKMRLQCGLTIVVLLPALVLGQFPFVAFHHGFSNFLQPVTRVVQPIITVIESMVGPRYVDDGTKSPVATGYDPLFPDDCGRQTDKGKGKLCFPDGLLCQNRK